MSPSAPSKDRNAPTDRDVPARVRYIGKPDMPVSMDLLRRSRHDRIVRAAQGWGMCWGAAVVAVFIPLFHFILVPGLLLAGPVVASLRWREEATVLEARGSCPGCEKAFAAPLRMPARPEISWRCSNCGRPLVFVMDEAQLHPESTAHPAAASG